MADNTKHLERSWNNRSTNAKEKALRVIEEMKVRKEPVNFNSVHIQSGISKNYLYTNEEIKAAILKERSEAQNREKLWHNKYGKTSKTKDVIIATKDRYIAKLEAENHELRKELNQLRAMIYEKK